MTCTRDGSHPCADGLVFLERSVADPNFFRDNWRSRPRLFRGLVKEAARQEFSPDRFLSWSRAPATARIYIRSEEDRPGAAQAWSIPAVEDAPAVFNDARMLSRPATLLLNGLEDVDPDLVELRREFGIGMEWRHDDIVATLSLPESSIGYHAGHEDGFILQMRGSRRWRVWRPELLPESYRRSILGGPGPDFALAPPRPEEEAILDCVLGPGDVLFIPGLHGHEGISKELSLSLSIAWRGLSYFRVLQQMCGEFGEDELSAVAAEGDRFYRLIPDPPPGESPHAWITRELVRTIRFLSRDEQALLFRRLGYAVQRFSGNSA